MGRVVPWCSVSRVTAHPARRGPPGRTTRAPRRAWNVGAPVLTRDVSPSPAERRVDRTVLRRGFAVLWVAVREEPWVFALAVGASALYATATVLAATVLGHVVQSTVLPSLSAGRTTTAALVSAGGLILAVALAKAVGIVGRRLGAGVMQYRLQATYRRRVTRQYLRLPMSWHSRHPTGQLLSNANADVEAAWYPIAPLPFAVGVVVMLVVAAGALVLADPVLALVGLAVFPLVAVLNVVYQRRLTPVATRAQQLRAEVSGVAHESFDGALVVKTLGREADETARFAASAAELRDSLIAVGRVRGLFDPVLEALPNLGVLAVLVVGSARVESGAITTGTLVEVAYLFTLLAFPLRAIGWVLGEMPRSVVGFDRVTAVLDATGELPFGAATSDGTGPAALELEAVRFRFGDAAPVLSDVTLRAAGRAHRGRGRRHRCGQEHPDLAAGAPRRPGVGRPSASTAPTCASWPAASSRPARPWCRSRRSSSTTRSGAT